LIAKDKEGIHSFYPATSFQTKYFVARKKLSMAQIITPNIDESRVNRLMPSRAMLLRPLTTTLSGKN